MPWGHTACGVLGSTHCRGYQGYSRYYTPGAANNQVYSYPNSGYSVPYRQQPGYPGNGYYPNTQPYAPQGMGVIINGRSYTLPR